MERIWNGYRITKTNSGHYSVKPEIGEDEHTKRRGKSYLSLARAMKEAENRPTGPYTGPKPQIAEEVEASANPTEMEDYSNKAWEQAVNQYPNNPRLAKRYYRDMMNKFVDSSIKSSLKKIHNEVYIYKGFEIVRGGGPEYPWNVRRGGKAYYDEAMKGEDYHSYSRTRREAIEDIDRYVATEGVRASARTTQRTRFKVDDVWQGIEWGTPIGSVRFDGQEDGTYDLMIYEDGEFNWVMNGTDVEVCRMANEMIRKRHRGEA